MRFSFQTLVNFILFLVFVLGLAIFVFWRFGIFKKEAELGEIMNVKTKVDFVTSYPYQNLTDYFQKLPTTKIEIPSINTEEIGRTSLF